MARAAVNVRWAKEKGLPLAKYNRRKRSQKKADNAKESSVIKTNSAKAKLLKSGRAIPMARQCLIFPESTACVAATSGTSLLEKHGSTLSPATLRSYKSWTDRFLKSKQTPRVFLFDLSPSRFRQAKSALKAIGIPLGDLTGLTQAAGCERITNVPDDDLARRIIGVLGRNGGLSGVVLGVIYHSADSLYSILRRPVFEHVYDVTVQRHLAKACKKLRLKRHYTINSIRYAGARKIARERGFYAAHKALGLRDTRRTEKILGRKVLDLFLSVKSVAGIPTPI